MKSGEFKGSLSVLWLVPIIILLFSCASKPAIIGKWKEVGKVATIEFSADGAFKAVDNQGMAVSGEYTLSKDGKLRCEVQQGGSSREIVNLMISIKGDELTLTSSDSREVEIYRREK
ncbi:MAG: hypothetical protein A2156_05080 [Deltaproteobacteria bacterium RBG_16_48_10]|nr:MAG: hypothetical protein A2156_05080 [Deltaproteobacteria bacterium RBG_16_48_10]